MHNATGDYFFYFFPSGHRWSLQCLTPSQSPTLLIYFPPPRVALCDMSNTKPHEELKNKVLLRGPQPRSPAKSFLCSPMKKTIPENSPAICQHLRASLCLTVAAKKWPWKTAKLHLGRSSERPAGAWLLSFQSPAATTLSLPLSNTSTERALQMLLNLLPSSRISQHLEEQGTGAHGTKRGFTSGDLLRRGDASKSLSRCCSAPRTSSSSHPCRAHCK